MCPKLWFTDNLQGPFKNSAGRTLSRQVEVLGETRTREEMTKSKSSRMLKMKSSSDQCPCAAAAGPNDKGGAWKSLILHRRRLLRLLHYPPSTVPHRQISQTGTFPSSTYIWFAPWTLPSQYWRVSVGTKKWNDIHLRQRFRGHQRRQICNEIFKNSPGYAPAQEWAHLPPCIPHSPSAVWRHLWEDMQTWFPYCS